MASRGSRNKPVYERGCLEVVEAPSKASSASSSRAPSRGAPKEPEVVDIGMAMSSIEFVGALKRSSSAQKAPSASSARAPSRGAPNEPVVYETKYLEVAEAPRKASSALSARASSAGSGKSAGSGYKEPSNLSIYKDYGGYMNFLHCHGLRLWNQDDVDEGHKILAEIKQNMRQEAAEASS